MSGAQAKQHAHQLIERMPTVQVAAVARLLEVMVDPVAAALAAAPIDDEPVSAAEQRQAAQGRKWLETHRGIPLEEVMAETLRRAPRRRR